MGGSKLEHDCGVERSIGYFLEPLIFLGLFAKKPITSTLKGITNDSKDPSIDTFRSTTFPILKFFGAPSEGLELEIKSRRCAPEGGGEVVVEIPVVRSLTGVTWTDEGLVKRIRGVTFSARVSMHFENTMVHAARRVFPSRYCYISLMPHGYGMSLVAETTSGCYIYADTTISHARGEQICVVDSQKKELVPPKNVGLKIASVLLGEIGLDSD